MRRLTVHLHIDNGVYLRIPGTTTWTAQPSYQKDGRDMDFVEAWSIAVDVVAQLEPTVRVTAQGETYGFDISGGVYTRKSVVVALRLLADKLNRGEPWQSADASHCSNFAVPDDVRAALVRKTK